MNVLILTPDRVGSTFLQRLLTVHMLNKGFDKPVVNLHELTNGIGESINEHFNSYMLHKDRSKGYSQSLPEIQELLEKGMESHYVTSRLAAYHLNRRQDPKPDQLEFYDFLNKNFYIISCRRENLFEHALSWMISHHSKVLNVYNPSEKVNSFQDVYASGISVQKIAFINQLDSYLRYIDWVDRYFNVQSYFEYETDIPNIEKYINGLEFMSDSVTSWDDMFGMDFNTWNKLHKLLPDLKLKEDSNVFHKELTDFNVASTLKLEWDSLKGSDWPDTPVYSEKLPEDIKSEIMEMASNKPIVKAMATSFPSEEVYNFVNQNINTYVEIQNNIDNASNLGLLPTPGFPIKLQTFQEKMGIINNKTDCVEWYNEWAIPKGLPTISLETHQDKEEDLFHNFVTALPSASDNTE